MKTFLIVSWTCLFFVAGTGSVPCQGKDQLLVNVSLTTGERSKDSSSQTTTMTVEQNAILWERTSRGRGRETTPLQKKFKLSRADKANLLRLIRSNNLLVTESIDVPRHGSGFGYFELSVELTLDGKKGAINISGPRTAVQVKGDKLYRNTLTLVKEIYRIMNAQDKSIYFSELIL